MCGSRKVYGTLPVPVPNFPDPDLRVRATDYRIRIHKTASGAVL